jgi:2-polyprenyl-6-methoxyphenol hydroxylase-like FAD-dependent oxidoreductase
MAYSQADVLIVGGGPVGLGLAIELGRLGIACRLVEKGDGVVHEAKMFAVGIRTMEICRRWGIAEDVRNWGFPGDHPFDNAFVTSLCGDEIARLPMPSMRDRAPLVQSPETFIHCPQFAFDPLLLKRASSLASVSIEHATQLTSFVEDDEGVSAHLVHAQTGAEEDIRALYLVGCDGFHGTVRECAGIRMEGDAMLGHSINITFAAPGLRAMHDKADALRFVIVGKDGPWASLVAADGRERWRLMIQGRTEVEPARQNPAAAIRNAIGRDDVEFDIISVGPWTRRHMVAESYRRGRVFIAGDAAHVMPPNGGLGMNTGLADIHNLGWKLAAVIKGWGGEQLFDTYEAERRPAGIHACAEAVRNFSRYMPRSLDFSQVESSGAQADAVRAEIGAELFRANRLAWEDPLGTHLGFVYEQSPICITDDGPSPAPWDDPREYVQHTAPGARAPHVTLRAGASTLDLFDDGFTLVCCDGADSAPFETAAQSRAIPLKRLHLGAEEDPARFYTKPFTIVRPEGHVAWRGEHPPTDVDGLWRRVTGN